MSAFVCKSTVSAASSTSRFKYVKMGNGSDLGEMSVWSRSRKRGVFKCLPLLPELTVSCGHTRQKGHVYRSKQIKLSHFVGVGGVCLFPISTSVLSDEMDCNPQEHLFVFFPQKARDQGDT